MRDKAKTYRCKKLSACERQETTEVLKIAGGNAYLAPEFVHQIIRHIFHYKHWGGPMGYPGVADIIGCYQGRMIAIELKSPNGKATPDQERFIQNVNDAGGIAFVARSIDEVIEGLGIQDRFLRFGG